ncbi:hypothetical protein ACONUD_12730 [Microbulbifer harenosus]|uniref:Glycosyltransferase family 4 protein n=1 Tax=Microbulbifer harenosus TaxID=2576840 RepID=A0ABY2UHJ0_9GAMM|nr:glycosyltransferase family 4 protein [Microbulbifer harenosus]TLM77317.1 glycosyltransferase family 4 protein [Microbulbifer harenosus]
MPEQGKPETIHLVVLELHHHGELLKNLYDTLKLNNFKLTLVTIPKVYKDSGLPSAGSDPRLDIQLKKPEEYIADFLQRMAPVFASADIIYFNTVAGYWKEVNRIRFTAPAIIRIHNAHCDLSPLRHFRNPVLNSPAILSHLLRKVLIGREWNLRKSLFEKIDYVMFPNETITHYVKDHNWVDPQKILDPVLPFGYLGEKELRKIPDINQRDTINIAITGKVTNCKKDFTLVYRALRKYLQDPNSPRVKLTLLGNAGHKQVGNIIRNFESLTSDRFHLDYSTDYVPAEEFEKKVASVDFFVAPIKIDTHFKKYREVYGKSKMSGVENDILRYRKPSLIPSNYIIESPLDKAIEYFPPDPESLANSIKSWAINQTYREIALAFNQMKKYNRNDIADNFYDLCKKMKHQKQANKESS